MELSNIQTSPGFGLYTYRQQSPGFGVPTVEQRVRYQPRKGTWEANVTGLILETKRSDREQARGMERGAGLWRCRGVGWREA